MGKSLLFKSDIIHSGEEFHSWYKDKELLMLTINITGIENKMNDLNINNEFINDNMTNIIVFDEFDSFMPEFVTKYNLIPFQIIISSGEYNNKTFSDTYIKYFNLQSSFISNDSKEYDINPNLVERINLILLEIYEKTKEKLNKRGRESHIDSHILEESTVMSKIDKLEGIHFNTPNINIDKSLEDSNDIISRITNYVNNTTNTNNGIIYHKEKINNTWEESTCNDDGDEYDEITYLQCKIDIKFCFMKI